MRAGVPDDVQLRRWAARAGRVDLADALRVAMATGRAQRDGGVDRAWATVYRRAVRAAYRDPVELSDLAIDGEDLIRAGVPPGRELGLVLRSLHEWVLVDPSRNAPTALLERARANVPRGAA